LLKIKQELIKLCEVLKGTLVERENGFFEIFVSPLIEKPPSSQDGGLLFATVFRISPPAGF